jgi:Tol biopolymer transport system component
MRPRERLLPTVVLVVFANLLACNGDDLSGPTTGMLEITIASSGSDPDPDGYTIQLDRELPNAIGLAARLSMSLSAGSHAIRLGGLADNCTVVGDNPRTISVTAGETSTVEFQVTCSAASGNLRIITITSGESQDADGYTVTVDDGGPASIGPNTTLTLGVASGSHEVSLSGVAANCSVEGSDRRQVTLAAGQTATVTFNISCLPRGTKILFESFRDGSQGIFTMNRDGSQQRRLTPNPGQTVDATWSPDGKKVAFMRLREGWFEYDIFVVNADGSGETQLTHQGGTNTRPLWSPDGRKIAFMSTRDGFPAQIFVMNADGSDPRHLTTDNLFPSLLCSWSPDGTRITFTRSGRIFVMNADGTNPLALTTPRQDSQEDMDAQWSPDGSKIAFSRVQRSEETYISNLWVMDGDGSNPKSLTNFALGGLEGSILGYSWSPDDVKLAFGSSGDPDEDASADIEVIGSDGTGRVNLTNTADGFEYSPVWSPDGSKILFSAVAGIAPDLFVMNPDGSNVTNLTNYPDWDGLGAWQP